MKTKHSFAALAAFLFALLPATQAWGNSTTTYYAALKVAVASGSTGRGLVYAGTSNTAGTYGTGMTSGTQSSTTKNEAKTFYAFAQASDNYEFSGWSLTDGGSIVSTDNPYSVSVQCSETSSSSPTTSTVYANFVKKQLVAFAIAFEDGDYTVNGGTPAAASAAMTAQTEATTITLTTSNENFYRYKIGDAYAYTASYTTDIAAATTVSIEFLTASQLATVSTLSDLQTALADGSVIKTTIPSGTEIVIPSGTTVAVPSGKILVVDGTLWVEGTLTASGSVVANGTISKCTKVITQTGDNGEPLNPYGSVKYWKTTTSSSSASITGFSGFKSHFLITNGDGEVFRAVYDIASPTFVLVNVDTSKAVNHITGIKSVSAVKNLLSATISGGMAVLVSSDCVINGGTTTKTTFTGRIDAAGQSLVSVSGVEVSNGGASHLLNCPSFTMRKSVGNNFSFYNCQSVTFSGFNASGAVSLGFYDCGTYDNPASYSATYSKNPGDQSSFKFYSGYYKSFTYYTTFKVYGGAYKSDPSSYLADTDGYEAVSDGTYYIVREKTTLSNVASINGVEYETLDAAIAAAESGAEIFLIEGIDLTGSTVEIPADKNVTIVLNKHTITGGKIINRGTLVLTDVTIMSESVAKCDIENYGSIDFVFGTYSGAVVNRAGTLTTHNGVFSGSFSSEDGTVNLKGGHFATDVSSLVTAIGYDVVKDTDGRFCVCELPDGTMYGATVSGAAGYGATPYSDADFNLMYSRVKSAKTQRSDDSVPDWKRLAQLLNFYQVFNNSGLDATIVFDRAVAANSVNLYAKSSVAASVDFKFDLPAGKLYRALTETMIGYGKAAKTYYSLWDESIKSVAMAVTDKSGDNAGTICKAMVELWESQKVGSTRITNTVYEVGAKYFVIGADSNKAMIRPATGAATFYSTLGAAMSAAADGGTVMLANDCDTALPLTKAGTYTFDTMGFAHSDEVSVADGLFVRSETAVDSSAKVLIADAVAKTYVVAQKVASAGETFYDNLAEAVAAANGAVVTLLAATDETVTLGEGQSLKLAIASGVSYDVDSKIVVDSNLTGYGVKATAGDGYTLYSVVQNAVSSGEENYASVEDAISGASGNTVEVTVTADITEEVPLAAGKTLAVTVPDGVSANVTVKPVSGAFVEAATSGATTTYVAKQITVELDAPQSVAAVEVAQVENGVTNEVTDVSVVNAAVAELTDNSAVARADNTDATTGEVVDNLEKIEVVPSAIVQETVGGDTFIRSATFEVTPSFTDGRAEAQPSQGVTLKFRLPVDAESTQLAAVVSHEGAQFGVYPVLSYNGEKFIEVESDAFSAYGYTLLDGETANPVAAIGTTGYASLAEAIAAAQDGDTVTLLADSAEAIVISSEIAFTLDTNGYTYSGSVSTASGYGIATSSTGTATTYTIAVDPYAAYVKVADGFYQNAATYAASTDFYITSKAGLLYFRTLVNADDGGTIADAYAKAHIGSTSTAVQFYQGNIFTGKTVHLMEDVDMENADWTPIGYPHADFNSGNSKTYFYGNFNGEGHTISNIKVVVQPVKPVQVMEELWCIRAFWLYWCAKWQ